MPSEQQPLKADDAFPVPVAWRRTLEAIVASFVRGDFKPSAGYRVEAIDDETVRQITCYVEDYGDVTLVPLTEEAWLSSVAMWLGDDRWEVLVDLRTAEEERSDLVLHAHVREVEDDYVFSVYMVYVP
jgi:hypothetical protein